MPCIYYHMRWEKMFPLLPEATTWGRLSGLTKAALSLKRFEAAQRILSTPSATVRALCGLRSPRAALWAHGAPGPDPSGRCRGSPWGRPAVCSRQSGQHRALNSELSKRPFPRVRRRARSAAGAEVIDGCCRSVCSPRVTNSRPAVRAWLWGSDFSAHSAHRGLF